MEKNNIDSQNNSKNKISNEHLKEITDLRNSKNNLIIKNKTQNLNEVNTSSLLRNRQLINQKSDRSMNTQRFTHSNKNTFRSYNQNYYKYLIKEKINKTKSKQKDSSSKNSSNIYLKGITPINYYNYYKNINNSPTKFQIKNDFIENKIEKNNDIYNNSVNNILNNSSIIIPFYDKTIKNTKLSSLNNNNKDPNKKLTNNNSCINLTTKDHCINGNGNLENNSKNDNFNIKLSTKEKAFKLLTNSPILRLCERLIFSKSTKNLRAITSIPEILNKNILFLEDKKNELKNRVDECVVKINKIFTASKTAEITFNFILSNDEEEFKNLFLVLKSNKEKREKYFIYVKILYLIFDESYEGVDDNKLVPKLYNKLEEKGFKSIRDYLYYIYIKKRQKINMVYNIDDINNLMKKCENNIFEHSFLMSSRFILFMSFLVKEVINYANSIKDAVNLKLDCENFLDIINKKVILYQSKFPNFSLH